MDTLASMRVFCLVSELGSFVGAANRLRISPAMVSKHVAHLEARLKTRLLNRTSRRVSLTEMGAAYLTHVKAMLDNLENAEESIGRQNITPRGLLRITGPVWLANARFARIVDDYSRHYPDVEIEIDLNSRIVNIVEDSFDLALRMSRTIQDGLVVRKIRDISLHLVASPQYLEIYGTPNSIEELSAHKIMNYSNSPFKNILHFKTGDHHINVTPHWIFSSNNETLLYQAAILGIGMTFLPMDMIDDDIKNNKLIIVLSGIAKFDGTLHAVYASRSMLSANIRTFIDFFLDHM